MVKLTCMDASGRIYQHEIPDPPSPPADKTTTIIGLDLGQRQDYTALAGVQKLQHLDDPPVYQVRRLKRWREEPYTAIRDELLARLPVWELTGQDRLVVDATGVGVAVTDIFREAKFPTKLEAITITAGFNSTRVPGGWHVPKRDLIAVVAVLLEQRRITVADGLPESQTLKAELGNFRTKITAAGNDTFAAWREADHDDLVLAVALACWSGEHGGGTPAYIY